MELQFHKDELSCLQRVKWEVQNQEQTQEVRLTDGMPDIGTVLGVWGQVLMRSKEWRGGGMSVSGGVMVWVLYAPEEGGQPQSVESWIPFQMKWDFPDTDRDGMIRAACRLRNVDARSTSARKLMVRASVGVLGEAMIPGQVALYSPEELPEDVQLLQNTYPIRLPREAGEKPFNIEEELTLPAASAKPEKLIRYELRPELIDQKVMAGKVVFRGAAILHVLYRGEDGQFYSWDFELPFSQYSELDNEYEQDATARVTPAVTGLELDMDEQGRLRLKAGLTCQYVIYDRTVARVVEDAYSPRRTVTPKTETLQMPMVLDEHSQTIHAEQTVAASGSRVADVFFCPDHPRTSRNQDKTEITLPGQFQTLYYDMEGKLQSAASRWEGNWSLNGGENSQIEAMANISAMPQASFGGGGISMRSDLMVDTITTAQQGIPAVTALELGELTQPDPDRPSLILRKAGKEKLWNVAKSTGSTVAAIRGANHLQEEPEEDQILLIPVP